jgi:hypothetical protein
LYDRSRIALVVFAATVQLSSLPFFVLAAKAAEHDAHP